MKENDELLPILFLLLADELADLEYSQIRENVGSGKLNKMIRKPAMSKMQNTEWLIEQIIFFKGSSSRVSNPYVMRNHKSVSKRISDDFGDGSGTVNADELTRKADDQHTADLLKRIHKMQKSHVDWIGMTLFN